MMPDFATVDVGALGREWWRRCQPQIGQALAIGVLFSLLVGGGLAVKQVSLDTLTLWAKYQFARSVDGIGLSSIKITWPGERGESLISVGELLKTPGLDAWAEPVTREIGYAASPALVSGLLAIVATLLWSVTRIVPARDSADSPAVAAAVIAAPPVAVEKPLPVILPHLTPPPVELPHPTNQNESRSPGNRPQTSPREASDPVVQPSVPPLPLTPTPPRPAAASAGRPSLAYEFYWGLAELPFENVPDPKFYFPAPMHQEALQRLLYGIQTRKGAVMLTGEIGCGKTLLSRALGRHLSSQQYDMALIANPSFGVEDFLTEVLYQFGIEPTTTKINLLHLLNERLHENNKKNKQTLIVVDEAQAIPDNQVFEELRLLLNFQLNDRFLLTLVLMGQPELNDRVTAMTQFAQRISIKYHLGTFSQEETAQYVAFRLKAAQCRREMFTKDALAVVFQRSGGIPRNINRLCDLCLLIGSMDRAQNVDGKIAQRAAADLA